MVEKKYPLEYELAEGVIIPILVVDLPQAKEFYQTHFGFHPVFTDAEDMGWVELELPIPQIRLGVEEDRDKSTEKESKKAIFGIYVKDLHDAKEKLESNGVECDYIRDIPEMVSLMNCWDPSGNLILLMSTPRV